MSDDANPPATGAATGGSVGSSNLNIPEEVQQKFPDLLQLIVASESMNDEERQYWINILPIMTPEQLNNLRDILENEKRQLAAIDAKYQTEVGRISQEKQVAEFYTQRQKRRSSRVEAEAELKTQEAEATEDVLKQIEEL